MSIDELIDNLLKLKKEGIENVRILSKHDSDIEYDQVVAVVYDFGAWKGSSAILVPDYL